MFAKLRGGALRCSFCRKSDKQAARLLGGPGVYICDACVGACTAILAAHDHAPTDFQGWEKSGDEELLASLKGTEAMLEAVRGELQTKVDILRRREVSWALIGKALGISRQAAWERFS